MPEEKKSASAQAAGGKEIQQPENQTTPDRGGLFHPRFMSVLADEVAKLVIQRLPKFPQAPKKKSVTTTKSKQVTGGYFLDTSAIIDGRIFDVIHTGLLGGVIVVLDSVLLELKHIADSKDPLKKDRGRRGLESLEKMKKNKEVKVVVLAVKNGEKEKEVDEQLISITKTNKGKLITCDYNLEKKASVHGVKAINMHALAQHLKVAAVPGENVQVKLLHVGKDSTQGVGYLEDGTMIVVEKASDLVGQIVDAKVSRVIQTATGKILFAKKQV
jgi:uncharacterized protein YacL